MPLAERSSRFLLIFPLFLVLGCGGGDTARVTGKVTAKGAAVANGTLMFIPLAEGGKNPGKPASGSVKSDGSYFLSTYSSGDGAVLGRHRVMYSPIPPVEEPLKPGEDPYKRPVPPPGPYEGLVPKPNEVEVKSSGNTIDIELVPPDQK